MLNYCWCSELGWTLVVNATASDVRTIPDKQSKTLLDQCCCAALLYTYRQNAQNIATKNDASTDGHKTPYDKLKKFE